LNYRTKEEVDVWREKDSIERFRAYLVDHGIASEEETAAIEHEVQDEVDKASEFAKASAEPDPSTLMTDIFSE